MTVEQAKTILLQLQSELKLTEKERQLVKTAIDTLVTHAETKAA